MTKLFTNKSSQHKRLNLTNQSVQFKDNRPEATTQLKAQQMANQPIQRQENKTGMPDNLKSGIENLSGLDMSDVKVHYNSPQPAQLQAHAFAQGNQIHIASGQEKHLPHEAWHVVQQKQGRVQPTKQLKSQVNINDDAGLEKEADVMGARALQLVSKKQPPSSLKGAQSETIQRVWVEAEDGIEKWDIPIDGVQWFTDGHYYWFDIVASAGNQFEASSGIRNRKTHARWKELGAGDLPESHLHYEAMHKIIPSPVVWGGVTMTAGPANKPLGPARRLPFYQWLFEDGPDPSKMNCYEVVLYASVKAGIRQKSYVKRMIQMDPGRGPVGGPELAKHFTHHKLPDSDVEKEAFLKKLLPQTISRGAVVVFGSEAQHVALSAGITNIHGHVVLELDQKTGGVTFSTIEEITEKYRSVAWGPLP